MDTQAEAASAAIDPIAPAPPSDNEETGPPSYLVEQRSGLERMDGRIAVESADAAPESSQIPDDDEADDGAQADAEVEAQTEAEANVEEPDPTQRPAVLELIEAATGADRERPDDLVSTLESLIFVAEEAPTVRQLAEATNVSKDAVEEALDELEQAGAERGIRLQRNGSKVRLVSAPEAGPWIERFLGLDRPNKLSKASLETLAIVAYRQPITRAEVERVRGVSCDAPFQTLRSRDLIEAVGQVDGPGRPNLWAVTDRFLDHFGLRTLAELPPLPMLTSPPAEQGKLTMSETPSEEAGNEPAADPDVDEQPEARAAAADLDVSAEAESGGAATPTELAAAGGSGD